MSQTSQATSTGAVSEAQRGLRYRVLIVEDDADIRELIRYNLAQEGFVVEEAADGVQALEKVKRRVPDLLLLDLMLPGMPGLQVCRQMRAGGARQGAAASRKSALGAGLRRRRV
jgi:CheY-like chemotaxis protein